LAKEHDDQISYDPVIGKHFIVIIKRSFILWIDVMVDTKANEHAANKKLDIGNEALCWRSLDSVDV
jgi:hypothetical protein